MIFFLNITFLHQSVRIEPLAMERVSNLICIGKSLRANCMLHDLIIMKHTDYAPSHNGQTSVGREMQLKLRRE